MASPAPRFAAVVRIAFEPAWLALSREQRRVHASELAAICARHPDVAVRWFDADALGSGYTDFVWCEFVDPIAYHFLWEELRDTIVFARPYAAIRDVAIGIERGYQAYEERAA